MSGKGGLSAIPILPQNMLATKEENPRIFYGQCCYLVWWFILLCLFIVYAAFNLKDYLETQDNPIIALSIDRAEKINYPVYVICPFAALQFDPTDSPKYYGAPYYDVGLQVNQGDLISFNKAYVLIDTTGGAHKKTNPEVKPKGNKKKGKSDDPKQQQQFDKLNLGNTGSLFPARRDACGVEQELLKEALVVQDKEKRERETKEQNLMSINYYFAAFRSLAPLFGTQFSDPEAEDHPVPGYYPCIIFNTDRRVTKDDQDRFTDLKPYFKSSSDCKVDKGLNKSPLKDKSKKAEEENEFDKARKEQDLPRAYATDVGYYDGYVIEIYSTWFYDATISQRDETRVNGKAAPETVTGLSISLFDSVDEITALAAEYANLAVPVGSTSALYLTKILFQCEECEDDELTPFFNATLNILDFTNVPPVPCYDERPSQAKNYFKCQDRLARTTIRSYYTSMTLTKQTEIVTQGPLDYLGNFAGMLGTLLSFTVLGSIDRLCSYVFIGNGAMASVWDEIPKY